MTAHSIVPPELNYVSFTGEVTKRNHLSWTKLNIYELSFEVTNTITGHYYDGEEKKTNYVLAVETWGRLAESLDRILSTGSMVTVEGSLASRTRKVQKHVPGDDPGKKTLVNVFHTMVVKATNVTILNATETKGN